METIREAGGKFQSLSGPWADTTTHAGKLIMVIFAGIAEFERDLIRERTGAGRQAAKKRGVRFGRPPKLSSEQEQLARRLVSEGKSLPALEKEKFLVANKVEAWHSLALCHRFLQPKKYLVWIELFVLTNVI
jgi:DNA invertase Pin-like site-specific DNA recombinase